MSKTEVHYIWPLVKVEASLHRYLDLASHDVPLGRRHRGGLPGHATNGVTSSSGSISSSRFDNFRTSTQPWSHRYTVLVAHTWPGKPPAGSPRLTKAPNQKDVTPDWAWVPASESQGHWPNQLTTDFKTSKAFTAFIWRDRSNRTLFLYLSLNWGQSTSWGAKLFNLLFISTNHQNHQHQLPANVINIVNSKPTKAGLLTSSSASEPTTTQWFFFTKSQEIITHFLHQANFNWPI